MMKALTGGLAHEPGTPGVQMQPPENATTVRVEDGRTLTTDGPFVATRRRWAATCCSRPTTFP